MIYLFHGTDSDRVRRAAFDWVQKARTKEPQLSYTRLAREELSDEMLMEVAQSGGLFVSRLLVLLDDPFQTTVADERDDDDEASADSAQGVAAHIDALAATDNAIVVLAPRLGAVALKKLLPKVTKEYQFDMSQVPVRRGFNSALVDALGARTGARLWLEIMRALKAGDAPEMVHGLLHWKARDLMQKGGRAWTPEEARALSMRLLEILQQSRRGGLPLTLALEKFALEQTTDSQ